jgi:hypothetical protein
MALIECSALFAATNRRSPPGLAVLGEEGRRFSEDLAFLGERAHLAAQPAQLLALVAGQALGLALSDVKLAPSS